MVCNKFLFRCNHSEMYEMFCVVISGLAVAEPPKLSRLKCVNHHPKGNISLNALQTEQFLVCWVTSRYNHRFSDRTSIPRTKASPEILQTQFLQHRHSNDYKPVENLITKPNLIKTVIQAMNISSESKQRKMKHDHYNTSPKVYQASPSLVSIVIVIAGRRRIPFYGPARRQ